MFHNRVTVCTRGRKVSISHTAETSPNPQWHARASPLSWAQRQPPDWVMGGRTVLGTRALAPWLTAFERTGGCYPLPKPPAQQTLRLYVLDRTDVRVSTAAVLPSKVVVTAALSAHPSSLSCSISAWLQWTFLLFLLSCWLAWLFPIHTLLTILTCRGLHILLQHAAPLWSVPASAEGEEGLEPEG